MNAYTILFKIFGFDDNEQPSLNEIITSLSIHDLEECNKHGHTSVKYVDIISKPIFMENLSSIHFAIVA